MSKISFAPTPKSDEKSFDSRSKVDEKSEESRVVVTEKSFKSTDAQRRASKKFSENNSQISIRITNEMKKRMGQICSKSWRKP